MRQKTHTIKIFTSGVEHSVQLPGVSKPDYQMISETLFSGMSKGKVREAIAASFELAVNLCPDTNHSDVWHHIIYRQYLTKSTPQSWVRTSGEAFELFLCHYYTGMLSAHGIRLEPLFSRGSRLAALREMAIPPGMGGSKLDIAVTALCEDGTQKMIGGIHAKASLAERISDDAPVSMAMIERGYWSPLCTLDVKTYPPRDLTNCGELGTHQKPSDKRQYIENEGQFSACYSYNQRTQPSGAEPPSGCWIHRLDLKRVFDQLCRDAVAARERSESN